MLAGFSDLHVLKKTERDPSAKHESRAAGVRGARRGGHTTRGPSLYHAVRRAQCDRVPVSRPRPTWSVLGTVARAWRPETRRNAAQTKTPPRPPPSTQELERFCPSAFLCPVRLMARILRRLEGTGLVSSALDASSGCRHLRGADPFCLSQFPGEQHPSHGAGSVCVLEQ